MTDLLIQSFGYLATLMLALSLLVTNDLRFRWLNALGCLSFIVYGVLLRAYPVILTNALLLCINAYYLYRIYHRTEDFDLVPFNADDPLIRKFFSFYKADIAAYFPSFKPEDLEASGIRYLVLRDMNLANVFVAETAANGDGLVKLNYTIPRYRDFKVGPYIFEKEKAALLKHGVRRVVYDRVHKKSHAHFLKVTGFLPQGSGYVKSLS